MAGLAAFRDAADCHSAVTRARVHAAGVHDRPARSCRPAKRAQPIVVGKPEPPLFRIALARPRRLRSVDARGHLGIESSQHLHVLVGLGAPAQRAIGSRQPYPCIRPLRPRRPTRARGAAGLRSGDRGPPARARAASPHRDSRAAPPTVCSRCGSAWRRPPGLQQRQAEMVAVDDAIGQQCHGALEVRRWPAPAGRGCRASRRTGDGTRRSRERPPACRRTACPCRATPVPATT